MRAVADSQHVVRTDEQIDLAGDEVVAAVGSLFALDRMQDGEQRIAVLLDLGPLVAMARVVDRELVQAELLRHFVQLVHRRLEQRHPDEAVGPAYVLADILARDVGKLAAVLVRDTADEHGGGAGNSWMTAS
jgi:hypothetical protein